MADRTPTKAAASGSQPLPGGRAGTRFQARSGPLNHSSAPASGNVPFWRRKKLTEMTKAEWVSLCDGCGRCCLNKLEEEDTGEIFFTHVVCKLFDAGTCRCTDYANRQKQVPDCVKLTPEEVLDYAWLPPTCGYRLLAEGKELMWWHPLVSGSAETVHQAGVSLKSRAIFSEVGIPDSELEGHIVKWPGRVPKGARRSPGRVRK